MAVMDAVYLNNVRSSSRLQSLVILFESPYAADHYVAVVVSLPKRSPHALALHMHAKLTCQISSCYVTCILGTCIWRRA